MLGNKRGGLAVVIQGTDKNGGTVYASQEKGGRLLYEFTLPDFNDDDFLTVQNWTSQFLNAHSE